MCAVVKLLHLLRRGQLLVLVVGILLAVSGHQRHERRCWFLGGSRHGGGRRDGLAEVDADADAAMARASASTPDTSTSAAVAARRT
jgi:hypothetical protein